MKPSCRMLSAAAMLFLAVGGTALGAEAPQCLRTDQIDSTKAVNDSTILFYMRDHKVWVNHLQSPCLGLTTDGFKVAAEPTDIICANVETIRTLQFPSVCKLGAFTASSTPAPPGTVATSP